MVPTLDPPLVSVQEGLCPGGSLSRRVSVQGSLSRGCFCLGVSVWGGVSVRGGSLSRGLCPRGSVSRGGLCPGGGSLSGWWVTVWGGHCLGGHCLGGLCPGDLCLGGLCRKNPQLGDVDITHPTGMLSCFISIFCHV